ncbi:RluA family pseudouridine synthase [bacterium]|jgi:23S rRNA pseudouridine1911/1915/1917 synthase|nr:RluA family pseudouridine synthase [bacterium]MBT5015055.1 RluA family pseudouridine synthase [bacterium]
MDDIKFMEPNSSVSFSIEESAVNQRIDAFLSEKLAAYSRSFLQKLIKDGCVTVNDKAIKKPSYPLEEGDRVVLTFPPAPDKKELKKIVDDLGARIVKEHPHFFIVFKPAGLTMHAAHKGDTAITLVDWLLAQFESLASVGEHERPGIVHRLDKYTSGLVIIPRNNYAHAQFSDMFKERNIEKTYLALVKGHPRKSGFIDLPITTHSSHTKMTTSSKGRLAQTGYTVLEYFKDAALVEARPKTGRTHQIRVHLSSLGHSLLGDVVYGRESNLIGRQALHAQALSFDYDGKHYTFAYDVPEDFQQALDKLRKTKIEEHEIV